VARRFCHEITALQRLTGSRASKGDVCLASERSIKWRASGISETSNPRPVAFSASRFDLELRAQMSLFSVGECRWTITPDADRGEASLQP
jgi:hypothetical protein